MHFVRELSFTVPEKIGTYQVICMDYFQDQWDKIAEKYIPDEQYDAHLIVDDETSYPYGPEFYDEKTGKRVSAGCTGFFLYVAKKSEGIEKVCFDNESEKQDSYYLKSKYNNDTYLLNGEPILMNDAVELAEIFVSDFTETVDYPQDLDAGVAVAHQLDTGETILEIVFRNLYQTLPICSMPPTVTDDITIEMFPNSVARAYLDETDTVNCFIAQCAFEDDQLVKQYDRILTPSCAVRLLSETLSDYTEYDVIGMELVYVPVLLGAEDPNPVGSTHREAAPWSSVCSYDIVKLTPYWAIYMDVTPTAEMYGLVDCETGKVEWINNQR